MKTVKRKIVGDNCYGKLNGVMQKLPVGTIIEASEGAFGAKAVTVEELPERTLEVATPPEKPKRRSRKAVDHDAENN